MKKRICILSAALLCLTLLFVFVFTARKACADTGSSEVGTVSEDSGGKSYAAGGGLFMFDDGVATVIIGAIVVSIIVYSVIRSKKDGKNTGKNQTNKESENQRES